MIEEVRRTAPKYFLYINRLFPSFFGFPSWFNILFDLLQLWCERFKLWSFAIILAFKTLI